MNKIGRNDPCPCGSGKKHKHCCASAAVNIPNNAVGGYRDLATKTDVYITTDVLLNQLSHCSKSIAEGFDRLCSHDLELLSTLQAEILLVLSLMSQHLDQLDDFKQECLILLNNANKTFTAAVQLLRCGFRLQPNILTRNIMETISTIFHLSFHIDDLPAFQQGKLKSHQTVGSAKRVVPVFGRMYGFVSDAFAHVGAGHREANPIVPYTSEDDPDLRGNISFLKMSLWLIYLATELVFYQAVQEPKYWRHVQSGEFILEPFPKHLSQWHRDFFGEDVAYENYAGDTEEAREQSPKRGK